MKKFCIILSCILVAAHFLRSGSWLLVILCLALPLLLLLHQTWSARLMQGFLALAGIEWIRTLWAIAQERQATDRPWLRMAIILGTVAFVTLLSAWFARPSEHEKITDKP